MPHHRRIRLKKKPVRRINRRTTTKKAGRRIGRLARAELQAAAPPGDVVALHRTIEDDGGKGIGIGSHSSAAHGAPRSTWSPPRPINGILSETHVRKLETVISKLGRFLDPIIAAVPEPMAMLLDAQRPPPAPAMKTLAPRASRRSIPEPAAAYQILALNTEKAHNLREKALEVIRGMYRAGLPRMRPSIISALSSRSRR